MEGRSRRILCQGGVRRKGHQADNVSVHVVSGKQMRLFVTPPKHVSNTGPTCSGSWSDPEKKYYRLPPLTGNVITRLGPLHTVCPLIFLVLHDINRYTMDELEHQPLRRTSTDSLLSVEPKSNLGGPQRSSTAWLHRVVATLLVVSLGFNIAAVILLAHRPTTPTGLLATPSLSGDFQTEVDFDEKEPYYQSLDHKFDHLWNDPSTAENRTGIIRIPSSNGNHDSASTAPELGGIAMQVLPVPLLSPHCPMTERKQVPPPSLPLDHPELTPTGYYGRGHTHRLCRWGAWQPLSGLHEEVLPMLC